MKANIKEEVERFMLNIETTNLNSNEFIVEFYQYRYWIEYLMDIKKLPSVESLTRARRKIISETENYERTWLSRDTEEVYVNEFFTPVP